MKTDFEKQDLKTIQVVLEDSIKSIREFRDEAKPPRLILRMLNANIDELNLVLGRVEAYQMNFEENAEVSDHSEP